MRAPRLGAETFIYPNPLHIVGAPKVKKNNNKEIILGDNFPIFFDDQKKRKMVHHFTISHL